MDAKLRLRVPGVERSNITTSDGPETTQKASPCAFPKLRDAGCSFLLDSAAEGGRRARLGAQMGQPCPGFWHTKESVPGTRISTCP